MCGEDGHREPRCPNGVCLTCGSRSQEFVRNCPKCIRSQSLRCSVCKVIGHISSVCPDRWRRYHSTVSATRSFKCYNLNAVVAFHFRLKIMCLWTDHTPEIGTCGAVFAAKMITWRKIVCWRSVFSVQICQKYGLSHMFHCICRYVTHRIFLNHSHIPWSRSIVPSTLSGA